MLLRKKKEKKMYHVFYFVQCNRLNLCTIRLNNEFYIN